MELVSLFFICEILLSAVQASVININVIDEDELVKAAGTLYDCNTQECTDMCRSIGFSRGACVAGSCFCLSIKEYAKAVIENELNVEINDIYNSEVGDCSLRACEQLCSRLGFPGGACVNGKCDCDRFKEHAKTVVENEASEMNEVISNIYHSEVGDCSLRACEQSCRRLGFPGGACVNGKCDCDRFKEKKLTSSLQPLGCNTLKCILSCIRHGHKGGICLSGVCQCF